MTFNGHLLFDPTSQLLSMLKEGLEGLSRSLAWVYWIRHLCFHESGEYNMASRQVDCQCSLLYFPTAPHLLLKKPP